MTGTRADGRAEITNYFTGFGWRTPNSFEPFGHGIPGNAAELVTNRTANWTIFSNMGNLGIGNGSTATFGDPANPPASNYSDYLFQAGDVSQQPLDPVRELNLPVAAPAAVEGNESGNVTETNVTGGNNSAAATGSTSLFPNASIRQSFGDIRDRQAFNNTNLSVANVSQPTENETAPAAEAPAPPAFDAYNATYASYHPIWAGLPVNDLLYEHPLAPNSISTYCRLVGLATPSGVPINIGLRCLSYGY
jgi:hypothetical protein